jgi:hypothetical protein
MDCMESVVNTTGHGGCGHLQSLQCNAFSFSTCTEDTLQGVLTLLAINHKNTLIVEH